MGDPSDIRFVPSSCATTPIDWTKVPEASKQLLLKGWGTYYSESVEPTSQRNQVHFHIRKYDVIAMLFSLPTLPLTSHKPRKTVLMFFMYSAGLLYYF
jgi:hypothetical protein